MDDLDHACLKVLKLLLEGYSVRRINVFQGGFYETILAKDGPEVVVRTEQSMPVITLEPPCAFEGLESDAAEKIRARARELGSMEAQLIRGLQKYLESRKRAPLPDCLL